MRWLYNFIFLLFLVVSFPHALKRARKNPAYRGMWGRRWSGPDIDLKNNKPIWINGVSVGEVVAAKPLIDAIKATYPDAKLVISASTGTGFKRARELYGDIAEVIGYPFDLTFCLKRFFDRISPKLVINMELDLWPNFMLECKKREIPFIVANGRISESSLKGYRKVRGLLKNPFRGITMFLAQDNIDADRAIEIGIEYERVHVGGNLKYDLIPPPCPTSVAKKFEMMELSDKKLFLLASSHHDEEEQIADALIAMQFKQKHKEWLWILIPRHPERADVVYDTLVKKGLDPVLFSKVDGAVNPGQQVIVDEIGVLPHLYPIANTCFMGGSLIPHGGQNMMEPAGHGVCVVFGPHVHNFRESSGLLLQQGAAKQVSSTAELKVFLNQVFGDEQMPQEMGQKAKKVIESKRGASKYVLEKIASFM